MKFSWAKRLGAGGALVCLLLLVAFSKAKILWAFTAITYFDYVGGKLGLVLFDSLWPPSKGPVSTILEARLFDGFLILTSGLQWFLVGMVIDWVKFKRSTDQQRAHPR